MKNKGLHTHRLLDSPLELKFATSWDEMNQDEESVINYLLSLDNTPVFASDRDRVIAATIIQWLGSPVGEYWVRSVLDKVGDIEGGEC